MKITQEQLNQELCGFDGKTISYGTSKGMLTMRLLLVEVILCRNDDRSGDERLKGFSLAGKINERMGILDLDSAELKLISTRMDQALIVKANDYLYGTLHELLNSEKELQ